MTRTSRPCRATCRQVFVMRFERLAVLAAHEVADAGLALALDALEHHVLRSLRHEGIYQAVRFFVGDVGAAPIFADGLAQDDGGFGEVRCEDVGAASQLGPWPEHRLGVYVG